jgi:hypothetical protein
MLFPMQPGLIYLIGPSGHPNFGDEFITAAWLRYLAVARPDTQVWLDCPQPGTASVLFDGLHPNLRITNTLWRLVHENAERPVEEITETVTSRVTHLGSPTYDLGLLKLREAESLHLLGGGYINDNWAHHTGLIHAMRAVRTLTGARLYATGQGLMPALDQGMPAPELFTDFDVVSARDDAGAEAYGVTRGLDDAFLGVTEEIERSPFSDALYVCIQSDTVDAERFDAAVEIARSTAERAIEQGRKVYYVEAVPGGDRAAYERLADLIPEEHFLPFVHIWTHGLPLSAHQAWVTSRFHFHLLGAAAGGRGIAVGMKKGYYDVKHESVAALGSGWALALDDEKPSVPQERGQLSANLPALVAAKRAEAERLYPAATPAAPVPAAAARFLGGSIGGVLKNKFAR